jgi:hypothetical protein
MGWQLAGFFARADADVMSAALDRWPGMRGRLIDEPFHGIGVAVPEKALTYGKSHGDQESAQELAWAVEQQLPAWSAQYSATIFVFLRADCWGGMCFYEGYVCRDGTILMRAQDDQEESNNGGIALRRLVAALGVELPDPPTFAPFVRGYFNTSV